MGRPHCDYNIGFYPAYDTFKPEGIECDDCIELSPEEMESLRLKNIKNLDQTAAAKKMGVSQSTFQRVLTSAYKKVSLALIEGKELKILTKRP
ncbi:hypothetical protein A2954_01720 [Candidatus Roizmanbacteria bacterium RIFCSPLOWO2_01_FULL_37_12]|uniref:Uncharacterized protein n=1 Tax=Candidatus Roizmanbacteria bacterium RIFCSPLOWO2_01_FULL_37_12 TaxID=1802056 RepID=A0A1F7I9C3_9BACT|nr:MAG: hypothetical protein A2768_01020 [Candidatus Roizmanbacteria bacterium RIFCSPHIGHO2_01_FULL_37_16]OGK23105.1 MAG: hypothetical protein A3D76_05865 [Candidatus Roizmanbacteria bacterium RIFCSPHIGHO2_02_FULL_37_9b]OGK39966.1 MAG: hypothetical protein A2954_01720 [Candidatus Roizmanbacteria bacterium RIFCSPLOWO2_01_FULL_37_12]